LTDQFELKPHIAVEKYESQPGFAGFLDPVPVEQSALDFQPAQSLGFIPLKKQYSVVIYRRR
jgi:hypothetical protein